MDEIIAEADVAAKLKGVFQTPFLDVSIDDDGDLYVKDGLGYPIWVTLDEEKSFVKFVTFATFDDIEKSTDVLQVVNDLNHRLVVVRFSLNPDQEKVVVDADYFVSYKGGLSTANLVNSAKRFASTSKFGFDKLVETLREMVGDDGSAEAEDGQ